MSSWAASTKKLLALFALAAGASLALGCAPAAEVDVEGTGSQFLIAGMSPEEAYGQFGYRLVCSGGMSLHRGVRFDPIPLGLNDAGNKVAGRILLFLLDGETYSARYEEYEKRDCVGTVCAQRVIDDRWIRGSWRIEGNRLVVQGIGTATYLEIGREPALGLTIDAGFAHSARAAGKTGIGQMTTTVTGPGGSGQDTSSSCSR